MEKQEQFETLSRELLGKLKAVTTESKLFFPFEYKISEELEEKYFKMGTKLRSTTISNMIIIENSFKKFLLFPSHDIMVTYIETQKDLLFQWQLEMIKEYDKYLDRCEEDRKLARKLNERSQIEVVDELDENTPKKPKLTEEQEKKEFEAKKEKDMAEFKKVIENLVKEINEASKPFIKNASSSEEARALDGENENNKSQGVFSEFIHNTISSLFK